MNNKSFSDKEQVKADTGTSDEQVIARLRERRKVAETKYSPNRTFQREDLKFYAGTPDNKNQWPDDIQRIRSNIGGDIQYRRPCVTINRLPHHVRQVTNDQRQNNQSIAVIPANDKADTKVCDVYNGLIKHIEYISDAEGVWATACESQVIIGEGYVRIITEYTDEGDEQEIKLKRVRNPFSVDIDPFMQDSTGLDAEWCIISEVISRAEYNRLYPDHPLTGSSSVEGWDVEGWIDGDSVRIAEYFECEYSKTKVNIYSDGAAIEIDSREDKTRKKNGNVPLKNREIRNKKIKWYKSNGRDIIESSTWPGKYIPVVRVVGIEMEVDGKLEVFGLVRPAKDAQRLFNYAKSAEVEHTALQTKSPYIGYAGQFAGHENQWKTSNVVPYPFLEVNPEVKDAQGTPLPLPRREPPPMASTAIIEAQRGAVEDIKATTGQYNDALGMTSNARSGKAILARKQESDIGTYHYVDNLTRSKRNVGRQLVDLIPKIYDTVRVLRIIGEDGESSVAHIDPTQKDAVFEQKSPIDGSLIKKIFNLNVGKYDAVVTTGADYATRRQEALASLDQIFQTNPEMWKVAGDIYFKNGDFPGSQELAKRIRKGMDPKLFADDDNPALTKANEQIQMLAKQLDQMHQMLIAVNQSVEAKDVQIKQFKAEIDAYNAETNRLKVVQSTLSPEQVQDIALGTVHAAVHSGDLLSHLEDSMAQSHSEEAPGQPEGMGQLGQMEPSEPSQGNEGGMIQQ